MNGSRRGHHLNSQLEEELPTIEQMSALELATERHRLIEELLGSDRPQDAFERVAVLELYKADPNNLIAAKLVHVEKVIQRLDAHGSHSSTEEEQVEPAPTPAWKLFLKSLMGRGSLRD